MKAGPGTKSQDLFSRSQGAPIAAGGTTVSVDTALAKKKNVALLFAADELRADKGVIMEAVQTNWQALGFAPRSRDAFPLVWYARARSASRMVVFPVPGPPVKTMTSGLPPGGGFRRGFEVHSERRPMRRFWLNFAAFIGQAARS